MADTVTRFTAPFFVFDNIHDWINEVNLGNGLADLLCHFEIGPTGEKKPNPDKFVELANSSGLKPRTSFEEIRDLLLYHHPGYRSVGQIKEKIFLLDKDGNVSADDLHLRRIRKIRNAYVKAYNKETGENIGKLSIEQAIISIVPQLTPLEGKNGVFNVADILDVDVTLTEDARPSPTSIVNASLVSATMGLMARSNDSTNITEHKELLFKTDLLDKYFNGKSDSRYFQGRDTLFYLGGIPRCEHPEIKSLNLTDPDSLQTVTAVVNIIQPHFPTEPKIRDLAKRYIQMYMTHTDEKLAYSRRVEMPYTALEALNLKERKDHLDLYVPKKGDQIYGIARPGILNLAHMYKIPTDCLRDEEKGLIAVNAAGHMTSQDGEVIFDRLVTIRSYFNDLLMSHLIYEEAIKPRVRRTVGRRVTMHT